MELVNPGLGLIFWMIVVFSAVLFILKKFAWPSILQSLKDREQHIEEALHLADVTHEEMKKLKLDNEVLLKEAKEEREAIMNEARKIREKLIEDAKQKANAEADRIVESARVQIENERKAALMDIKNQIADISIEIAEKILREKLQTPKDHEQYIQRVIDSKQLN
ncbi:MAG: F-type H+-transporting ATPase subunit b [Bacteroidetes bacterium]|nr:MAG: F-type H+-transporting ATPase subunit b [Bacteroidota bacterium]